MYVDPSCRGSGLSKTLISDLIKEAREIGYQRILLDSTCYMKAAHSLYRSFGFTDTDYYTQGETDETFAAYMVYMENVFSGGIALWFGRIGLTFRTRTFVFCHKLIAPTGG